MSVGKPEHSASPVVTDEADLPVSSTGGSLPIWAYYLLGVLVVLLAITYGWRYYAASRPERCFERAMLAVSERDFDAVAHELARMGDSVDFAPQRHFLDGLLHLNRKQYAAAIAEFKQSELAPSLRAQALTLQGQALVHLGQWSDAEKKLQEAIAVDPTSADAELFLRTVREQRPPLQRFADAVEALRAGNLARVRDELEHLRRSPGYEAHCQFLNAGLLLRTNQPAAALEAFGLTVNDSRLRLPTLIYAGEALYQLGRASDAERLLQEAVAIDPTAVDAHRWLGVIYYDLGAMNQAAQHLTIVSDLDPRDPRPSRLMGVINKDYEHYDDAVKHFTTALERGLPESTEAEVRVELADSLIKLRQYAEAVNAIQLLPRSATTLRIQGECEFNQGNLASAERLLDEALDSAPDDLEALRLRGAVAVEQRDLDTALRVLSHACELYPADYFARFRLAQTYQKLGRTTEAERETKVADQLKEWRLEFSKLHEQATADTASADLRYQIGVLATKLQYHDLARQWFQAALALQPGHRAAAERLAELEEHSSSVPSRDNPATQDTPSPKRRAEDSLLTTP